MADATHPVKDSGTIVFGASIEGVLIFVVIGGVDDDRTGPSVRVDNGLDAGVAVITTVTIGSVGVRV